MTEVQHIREWAQKLQRDLEDLSDIASRYRIAVVTEQPEAERVGELLDAQITSIQSDHHIKPDQA